MADGDQAYDYRNDAGFQSAPLAMKAAYLMHVDPEFAAASPQDKQAYLLHLQGLNQQGQPEGQQKEGVSGALESELKGIATANPISKAYEHAKSGDYVRAVSDIVSLPGLNPIEQLDHIKNVIASAKQRSAEGRSPAYQALADAAQASGIVDPTAMEESVRQGDPGAVVTHAAVPAVLTAAGYGLAEGSPAIEKAGTALKEATGTALRTETGALRPTVKVAASGLGALAGHATGVPYAGELGGLYLGPKVADIVVPERPGAATAAERRPVPISRSPSYDPEAYKAGATQRSPAAQAKANALAERAAQAAAQETLPEGVIQVPEPRPTAPGENPNYMASVPRGTLLELAQARKPGAAAQLQQLGKPILYVPEEYQTGPKVTGELPGGPAAFQSELPATPKAAELPGGPKSALGKITLSEPENLGPGMGFDHIIRDANGNRIGSIQVEPMGEGTLHVHWLGGEFGPGMRQSIRSAIEDAYPDTQRIMYDRRRLAKGAASATTEPREMVLK